MRSKLTALLIGLLTAAFVGLAAVGGSLYWNRVAQQGQETARAELPALAAEQIPKVFGYDYQTVERSLMETYPLLAPDFRQQFEKDATAKVIPEARKRQLVVQISVVGIGVMTAQRDSGSVMVYSISSCPPPGMRRNPKPKRRFLACSRWRSSPTR